MRRFEDDDELTRAIVEAAQCRGLDPADHGVVPRARDIEAENSSLERWAMTRMRIVEAHNYHRNTEAYATVTSLCVMAICLNTGMPIWIAFLASMSALGAVLLSRLDG